MRKLKMTVPNKLNSALSLKFKPSGGYWIDFERFNWIGFDGFNRTAVILIKDIIDGKQKKSIRLANIAMLIRHLGFMLYVNRL